MAPLAGQSYSPAKEMREGTRIGEGGF